MRAIFPLAFGIALFLSPDFLTIFGNGLGMGGVWFLCLLIMVFTFHAYTIKSYDDFYSNNPGLNNEYALISSSLGNITGFIFSFIIKALLAVCMGVGLLATAGYAFNELFVRWFPNMGFTLLALGMLFFIGLFSSRVVKICQLVFVSISMSGIILLSIIGFFSSVDSPPISLNVEFFQTNNMPYIFICFVLLMGFEMANTYEERKLSNRFSLNITMVSLILGFIVLFVWGVVSLMYVAPERLSDTYIPHLITARAINGIYGREIMGLVVIFGSLGAVNALLSYVSSIGGRVFSKELPFKIDKQRYRLFSFVILILTIAVLLISGMAGEPEFETFTRGSIYLWLLNYGAVHLAMFVLKVKTGGRGILSLPLKYYGNLMASLFICALYCGLVLTDHETVLILKFTGIISGGALLLYLFYQAIILRLMTKINKYS